MKILFLLPYCPVPPNSGNKHLVCNLLRYVTRHSSCDLALLVEHDLDEEVIRKAILAEFPAIGTVKIFRKPKGVGLWIARIAALLCGRHPAFGRYNNRDLAVWLATEAVKGGYNLIHFDMSHMAPYRRFCNNVPTLLVASDAYSMAARAARKFSVSIKDRFRLTVEEWLLRNFEKKEYHLFNAVCTVSERDSGYLKELAPAATVRVIGIGLGIEYSDREILHLKRVSENPPRILCTGSLNHHIVAAGIIQFLKKDLPFIKNLHPQVEVAILGQNPLPRLKQCVGETAGVKHIDYVENYADFLDQDWIYVYPQECASGLQTKVQQAMALGLPVVGYDVSFGGLLVQNEKHCFVCNKDSDMRVYILRLLENAELRNKIGSDAAEYVRKRFSIQKVGEEMDLLYNAIL